MDEAILIPSPNWFQVSGLGVSKDGWLVYGGPSKSLCVLEPISTEHKTVFKENRYQVHVYNRAHGEKIVSVDISPEWPLKQCVLTGSSDGSVKQWMLERTGKSINIKPILSHDIHFLDKEEVAGVGYSNEIYAITVGCFGNIAKWDLNSNVVKTYNSFLKNFKPVCMSCSHHLLLNVAIGTKQGVIFVLDLNGAGKIVYKVRGQDEEILCVSWCPQYEVAVMKALMESEQRTDKKNGDAKNDKFGKNKVDIEDIDSKICDGVESNGKNGDFLGKINGKKASSNKKKGRNCIDNLSVVLANTRIEDDSSCNAEDSQESEVQEDDTFDIYKDHESDEFGHKKYQSDVIKCTKNKEETEIDFLTECHELREKILIQKNKSSTSMEELVNALDNTHVNDQNNDNEQEGSINKGMESSVHQHTHLLATVGKYGSVRIWSKTGKLVSSCALPVSGKKVKKGQGRTPPAWSTVLWYTPDTLLVADARSELLKINPLNIDCKNKLDYDLVHNFHKRGLFCIASDAPRVQNNNEYLDESAEKWKVWTVSQDRYLVCYNVKKDKEVVTYHTLGGFPYTIQPCPYDAKKLAVAVGDGAVRVYRCELDDNEEYMLPATVSTYWQNVQGKVLTVTWHPTKENLVAFGTAEARVGVIDVSKSERTARVLHNALRGGVYALNWGDGLLACGGGDLIVYDVGNTAEAHRTVEVSVDGQKWEVSTARWCPAGLLVGSNGGGVALLARRPPHHLLAVAHVYSKMIHCMDWHPETTSTSTEQSQYKNMIAVCSFDKSHNIVILEYVQKVTDDAKKLHTWKTLSGHRAAVLQVMWNPHRDAQLLSTAQDATIRVWDAGAGVCVSIFGAHAQSAYGATWLSFPQLADKVVSGGADSCVRLWDLRDHPAEQYDANKYDMSKKAKKKEKAEKKKEEKPVVKKEDNVAASLDAKIRASRKYLLPLLNKEINGCKENAPKRMFDKFLQMKSGVTNGPSTSTSVDESADPQFLKIFGGISEVNEVLDKEAKRHLDLGNNEAYSMLCVFRGQIDTMIQFATQKNFLDPYLLSIAPSVSLKYWKDTTQLYIAQIERMVAKGEEDKLVEGRVYGGPVYRRAASLLAAHEPRAALAALADARLHKEAYLLCRVRYMDSIAQEVLQTWAQYCAGIGLWNMAAVCFIALENITQAAVVLGKSNNLDGLSLAIEMAKYSGQHTFAEHIEERRREIQNKVANIENDELKELPTRKDLLDKLEIESQDEAGNETACSEYEDNDKIKSNNTNGLETYSVAADVEEKNTASESAKLDEFTSSVEPVANLNGNVVNKETLDETENSTACVVVTTEGINENGDNIQKEGGIETKKPLKKNRQSKNKENIKIDDNVAQSINNLDVLGQLSSQTDAKPITVEKSVVEAENKAARVEKVNEKINNCAKE